jgi:hypothetical protein
MKSGRGLLVLWVIPGVMMAALALPMLIYWGDLPDPMAIHWGFGGKPNGSAAPIVLLAGMVAAYAAAWFGVVRSSHQSPPQTPSFAAGIAGIGGLLVPLQWMTVLVNRGKDVWTSADGFSWVQLVIAVAIALVAGYVGWLLAPRFAAPVTAADTPLVLSPGVSGLWSGTGQGILTIGIVVAMVAIGLFTWGWTGLGLLVIAAVGSIFARVTVTAGPGGVVITLGWLGWPSWTIPLDTISSAGHESVTPMAYGGWGYRVRPGVRAIVVRSGQGLHLVRPDKPDFVVTVDDAATGSRLINALVDAPDRR